MMFAPHQRLAAGQAQLAHAEPHEGAAQPVELLERQDLGLRQEGHVFGHAIDAAEVAAIRDRDAQVADMPAEGVDHRLVMGTRLAVLKSPEPSLSH